MLHEEEVVVEKRAVPKERVRLEKDTVTDEQQVSDEVRKERIDVDTGGDQRHCSGPGGEHRPAWMVGRQRPAIHRAVTKSLSQEFISCTSSLP